MNIIEGQGDVRDVRRTYDGCVLFTVRLYLIFGTGDVYLLVVCALVTVPSIRLKRLYNRLYDRTTVLSNIRGI